MTAPLTAYQIEGRVNAWIAGRLDAMWFSGMPARHLLLGQWRETLRHMSADSPAAAGQLLALVREAWDEPTLTPRWESAAYCEGHGVPGPRWVVCPDDAGAPVIAATELDVLVFALEAA
jgi:hypothetical protein